MVNDFYRLALVNAQCHNLNRAVMLARYALCLDPKNDNSRRLLGLCLYELGDLAGAKENLEGFAEYAQIITGIRQDTEKALGQIQELASQKKWRKAEAIAGALQHQSVRILNIRACLCASSRRHKKASRLFAQVLEKDNGNLTAQNALRAIAEKGKVL